MIEVVRAFTEDVLAIAAMEQEPDTKEFILGVWLLLQQGAISASQS